MGTVNLPKRMDYNQQERKPSMPTNVDDSMRSKRRALERQRIDGNDSPMGRQQGPSSHPSRHTGRAGTRKSVQSALRRIAGTIRDPFCNNPGKDRTGEQVPGHRGALHQYGISEGFQWINGSFVENIEGRAPDHRQPKDIDVVTFFYKREDTREDYPVLFNPSTTQLNFNVDAYGVELGVPLDMGSAALIGFWHGLWSHRRDHVWKGFIQVALDPGEDPPAKRCLDVIAESEERR